MSKSIIGGNIAGMVGALVSMFVERAWRRRKEKQARQLEPE